MAKLKLGFVGVGGMGQAAHLINYSQLWDDCEVVALTEIRPKLGKKVAAQYGIPGVYTDHREMFAKEKLDGIVAIQQFLNHGALVPQLLEYGVPVITEKPLASSLASGEKILKAATSGKGTLYIGYHKRSDPASLYVKQQIAEWQKSGAMGKMTHVRVVMPPGDWISNGFFPVYGTDEQGPGLPNDVEGTNPDFAKKYDAFVNYYIHQINFLRYLLGESYTIDYVDRSGMIAAGNSASGVAFTLELGTYTTPKDWQEQSFVAFQKGWIKLDLPCPLTITQSGTVTVHEAPDNAQARTIMPTLPFIHAFRNQAASFLKAIRGEKTQLCTPVDALEDLRAARRYVEMLTGKK